jgi:hypothetical protein
LPTLSEDEPMTRVEWPSLPKTIADELAEQGETGMGFQVVSVRLADGRTFDRVAVIQCELVAEVYGYDSIPFDPSLVIGATVTHDKWRFKGLESTDDSRGRRR